MVAWVYLYCGVHVVFAESFDTIGRDIGLVRPTVLTGVPRVYEKLYAPDHRTRARTRPGCAARSSAGRLRAGTAVSSAALRGRPPGPSIGCRRGWPIGSSSRRFASGLGGRLRYLVSGSAPLDAEVAEFFCAIGLPIVEGYGLTETAPILTVNPPGAPRVGTVGRRLPGRRDPHRRGRRDPRARPERDVRLLQQAGGDRGGPQGRLVPHRDIGSIDAEGYLSITDRKKDLLVTSGGKKIAPQPIEATLKRSPLVAEAMVVGERRNYAAALIVPDFPALERRLKSLGRPPGERDELVVRPDVVSLYQEIVDALNRELSQFERIKRIALLPARVHHRVRRAHADAESEAESGRAEVSRGRSRRSIRGDWDSRQSSVVSRQSSVVSRQSSVVSRQSSVVSSTSRQSSVVAVVSRQSSVVSRQSAVSSRQSAVDSRQPAV